MPSNYRGYELNDVGEPSNWSGRERALFKDIIDKLPTEATTLVTSEHTHSKLVASDGDPDPAVQCDADGNLIIGTGIATADALTHIYEASAGTVDAVAGTAAVIESDDNVYLSFLTPNSKAAGIVWGDSDDNDIASLLYDHSSDAYIFKGAGALTELFKLSLSGILTLGDNVPLRAGGANGLALQEDGGAGVVIEDATGNLLLDDDIYQDGGGWQSYVASYSGWAVAPTIVTYYKKIGRMVIVQYEINGDGDDNASYFTLPATPAFDCLVCRGAAGADAVDSPIMMTYVDSATGRAYFDNSGGGAGGAAFGNGCNKWVCGQFWYEATS